MSADEQLEGLAVDMFVLDQAAKKKNLQVKLGMHLRKIEWLRPTTNFCEVPMEKFSKSHRRLLFSNGVDLPPVLETNNEDPDASRTATSTMEHGDESPSPDEENPKVDIDTRTAFEQSQGHRKKHVFLRKDFKEPLIDSRKIRRRSSLRGDAWQVVSPPRLAIDYGLVNPPHDDATTTAASPSASW